MKERPKLMIVGQMRAGKTAVARRLYYKHDLSEVAFADPLKRYADRIFRRSDTGKPRALYQSFGELCRQIDPMVWVRLAEARIEFEMDLQSTKGIVISDGRMPHEIEWARANGFKLIRVTAPTDIRIARARQAGDQFSDADMAHATEQYVDSFEVDYEIVNDGDLAELHAKVDAIMESFC